MEITHYNLTINVGLERTPDTFGPITVKNEQGDRQVDARIYGHFALHPTIFDEEAKHLDPTIPAVTLTHIKSGNPLATLQMNDPARLVLVMEALLANIEPIDIDWDFDQPEMLTNEARTLLHIVLEAFLAAYRESNRETCDCPGCTARRAIATMMEGARRN